MADGVVTQIVGGVGATDYIDSSGNIHKNSIMKSVLVSGQSQLASLSDYAVGTIAYTAGMNEMWQKGADGEWSEIGSEGGGGGGSSDFSTAEVTVKGRSAAGIYLCELNENFGYIAPSNIGGINDTTITVALFKGKTFGYTEDGYNMVVVSGNAEIIEGEAEITGDCVLTVTSVQ